MNKFFVAFASLAIFASAGFASDPGRQASKKVAPPRTAQPNPYLQAMAELNRRDREFVRDAIKSLTMILSPQPQFVSFCASVVGFTFYDPNPNYRMTQLLNEIEDLLRTMESRPRDNIDP